MGTELVGYETRYPAAVITLNCPQSRNALSMPMVDAIMAALHRAEDDGSVRALILTGAESAFSAGMDLKDLRRALDGMKFDKSGGALWADAFRGEELVDRLTPWTREMDRAVEAFAQEEAEEEARQERAQELADDGEDNPITDSEMDEIELQFEIEDLFSDL